MKTKKNKPLAAETAASADVGIASYALARLAEKLKTDLAKPEPQSKQKTSPRGDISGPKKSKSKETRPLPNKDTAEKAAANHKAAGKDKKLPSLKPNGAANPGKIDNAKEHKKQSPQEGKTKPKPQSQSALSPKSASSSKPISAKRNRTGEKSSQKDRPEKDSLLEEVIALGGTEADLELIDGINSDEDVEGDLSSVQKPKGKVGNDKSLQTELQAQLRSLGLTGEFPDASSDEDEYVTESDHSDKESSPPPRSKPVANTQQPAKPAEPQKPRVIDRPVQLSSSIVPTSQPKSNGLQVRGKLKLEPHPLWYHIERPEPSAVSTTLNAEIISHHHARGKNLLQVECDAYMSSNHITSSDRQFLSTIMTSGTQTDKLSALTLSISASPLHCQKQLDALLGMAKKKSRNEAVQAVAALKDLLIGNLLPDRKLIYFGKQPRLSSSAKDEELILWTFEDWLKGWYFQVLQVIEGLSMDPLPFVRNHMIAYILDLLKDKPEQEQLLLRLLVNKLGDGSKKIAAKASHFLLQLESAHPHMKSFVLHEMENLLFRPNTSVHAQYYTIITMNQTILTSRDTAVANRLIEVYFMLFVKLLRSGVTEPVKVNSEPKRKKIKGAKKPKRGAVNWEEVNQQEEEVNSKILSAVLTGVNRAFPFSRVENEVFEKNMDILYRITHDANFNTAIQALILIQQVVLAKQISSDRYYRTLYESLLDRRLTTSSKQALYLNLLFKSLKSDTNVSRVKAFIKRIVHITSIHSPGFICGSLFLLAELAQSRPELKSLWAHSSSPSEYDPRKRDPLYANAESSSLWELSPLLRHYHPTVQLYALNLMKAQANPAKPDLALHTVKHFLDRFVYRNPKQKGVARGGSIMQPLPGTDTSLVLGVRGLAKTERAVNSEEWWRQQVDQIKPDEIFFHRFFVAKEESEIKALGRKRKRGNEEDELDEDEIWEALVKSSKEEGGVGEVDIDEEDVDWSSDEEELDEDMIGEMNDEMEDSADLSDEDLSDRDQDIEEESESGEEGDINEFFDDEAEEVEADEFDEEDEERMDGDESVDSDEGGVDGRFEFGDDESDMRSSDEEIEAPAERRKEAPNKKRKLKSLPTFASAEDYADMLDD